MHLAGLVRADAEYRLLLPPLLVPPPQLLRAVRLVLQLLLRLWPRRPRRPHRPNPGPAAGAAGAALVAAPLSEGTFRASGGRESLFGEPAG